MKEEKNVTVEVLKEGVTVGGKKRSEGDVVTVSVDEATVLAENGIVEIVDSEPEEGQPEKKKEEGRDTGKTEDEWIKIDEELDKPQEEFPPHWKPEEDGMPQTLLGKVTRVTETKYGKAAIIENKDGEEYTVFQGRKALDQFFEEVENGAKVGLKYLGKQQTKDGSREYYNYRTVVKVGEHR